MKKTSLRLEKLAKEKRKLEMTSIKEETLKIHSSVLTIQDEPTRFVFKIFI